MSSLLDTIPAPAVTGPSGKTVRVRVEEIVIPTYLPAPPDKNPMFLEKRVYQGSSGRVYPLPFTDRIEEQKVDRSWKAIWLENEYLRALVLPELGGRIHSLQDLTNGYDLIYNQPVIKPALVALAGPWISGGIEFNWPQHHRPATFLPVDFQVEEHEDGSITVWCGDHDPMARMKGMHGVCLHPGKAFLELKVRAYNRTPMVQTFLWWANVATRVHEAYQSFFPPDVFYVADHARRSTSAYPLARGHYYGIPYGERGSKGVPPSERPANYVPPHCGGTAPVDYPPNDLSFYANIPTPCSYMCMGSKEDFFGGYDFFANAGIVHYANHHISPGKKQWTWGNHEFGYAWDRNLTDKDPNGEFPPYIELMAGVYTDNQPDFSFLQPCETKTWSQYWYPIQQIGPALRANLDAAVSLQRADKGWRVGVAVTQPQPGTIIEVFARGKRVAAFERDLAPAQPFLEAFILPTGAKDDVLTVRVTDNNEEELISCENRARKKEKVPPPATEAPAPEMIQSADELYLTGLHLEQYRHATRCPTLYWKEALRRDPLDARCNNAMGLWHFRRGEFETAEMHFRKAIERLTRRNANPYDGEPYYNLGLCLRHLGRDEEAYDALYKSVWNQGWASAGYHALAEIDCSKSRWTSALEHLACSLRFNTDNLRARNLKAVVLMKLGRKEEAQALVESTVALDPLDWWARYLKGEFPACDLQAALDITLDYARAGLCSEATRWLESALEAYGLRHAPKAEKNGSSSGSLPDQSLGALPLVHYYLGWLKKKIGDSAGSGKEYQLAAQCAPDYCFPARLEEIAILQAAIGSNPRDSRAPYYLGNLLYDRRRHLEAIRMWERSARLDPQCAPAWRNLGIGYFNIVRAPAKARRAYDRAVKADPQDARLIYERDQLWKRMGEKPRKRLKTLGKHEAQVRRRDDLSIELACLYNQVNRPEDALQLLVARNFQPLEGGEGGPLGQHVRSHLALGRKALALGDPGKARFHFESALSAPENLGEAKHILANQSDIHYWLGCALEKLGDTGSARNHWKAAATFRGDFQEMSVRAFSEMTYYSALSWMRLGRKAEGEKLLRALLAYSQELRRKPATIDYFATSLPTMLLFEDDLDFRQQTTALFLEAQARLGLGEKGPAKRLLARVLERDPNHALAADLSTHLQA